jgi:hypothetical protein
MDRLMESAIHAARQKRINETAVMEEFSTIAMVN